MTNVIVFIIYICGGFGISIAVFNYGYSEGQKSGYVRGRAVSFREMTRDN